MSNQPKPISNLLLTGVSGVGKSTLVSKLARELKGREIRGFFSEVIYKGDKRLGWRMENFAGEGGLLAHIDIESEYHMGRYGVDMELFHWIMTPQLQINEDVYVYLIDEIGIIAPWSSAFINAMDKLLDSDRKVVAVIRRKSDEYVDRVKGRDDVELWEVTPENRDVMLNKVLFWIENS